MSSSWLASLDHYCERVDASFWSEPLNAVTNAAFLLAAGYGYALWRRRGGSDRAGLWLVGVTAAIGIGSFLFHTLANRWSALADVLPIAIFIYSYFFLALRRFLLLPVPAAAAATAAFVAFNMSFGRFWSALFPGMNLAGSTGYVPAALALWGVGLACLVGRERPAGRSLLAAGAAFALSLFFRTVDPSVCAAWPTGTHFLWHVLNALVLAILMEAVIGRRRPTEEHVHGPA